MQYAWFVIIFPSQVLKNPYLISLKLTFREFKEGSLFSRDFKISQCLNVSVVTVGRGKHEKEGIACSQLQEAQPNRGQSQPASHLSVIPEE